MPPKVNFKFEIFIDHPEIFPELEARLKDFRPVFDDVIEGWARNNRDKFNRSRGLEVTGAQVDDDVFWKGLTPRYRNWKRKQGYPDQIMVATGALQEALTDADRFFHESTQFEVVFGTPMAPEEEMKVRYNWRTRPSVFLGLADQKRVERDVSNYLSFGENWKDVIFVRGMENLRIRNEAASMDMAFNDAINS